MDVTAVNTESPQQPAIRHSLIVILAAVISAAVFLLCYYTDNKYTAPGAQGQYGILTLTESGLSENPVVHLISGWEIYRGVLLTPEDFESRDLTPDEFIFIGQYGGFEGNSGGSDIQSPHGSATYRLLINLPSTPTNYMLELPEIYSSYNLYINGEFITSMGNPDPAGYERATGNSSLNIRASGQIEIILAVTDYSGFYSGLVYPPAFGLQGDVEKLLNTRLLLRAAVIALTLGTGLFYFIVWMLLLQYRAAGRSNMPLLYVALCACFVLYVSYPIINTLWPGGIWQNTYEHLAYAVMLLFVAKINSRISGIHRKLSDIFTAIGISICCFSLGLLIFAGGNLRLMIAYSDTLSVYIWLCALFLLASSIYGMYKRRYTQLSHATILLCAATVFAVSLIMDRVLPLFEPIRFGWFSEISGAVFVISIGIVMANEVAEQFKLRIALEQRFENMARIMEAQRSQYSVMIGKEEELLKARHDFRHHIEVIRSLAEERKEQSYVDGLLKTMTALTSEKKAYCKNNAVNAVAAHYLSLAETEGIAVKTNLDIPENTGSASVMDICALLGNCLENALEACRRMQYGERFISAYAAVDDNTLSFVITNSFDGHYQSRGDAFVSRKKADDASMDRIGVGVPSVRAICEKCGGLCKVEVTETTWKVSALVNI